jgi:dynamin 1-like protein
MRAEDKDPGQSSPRS